MLGVFEGVIKRASLVLDAIQDNKHIERLSNENISAQDQQYKNAVDKVLALDALKDDLSVFFQDVFP